MSRRSERAEAERQAAALRESIRPPQPELGVDVAAAVRAELARQREADAAEADRVEAARFEGGPCWCCGSTQSWWCERDGTRSPGWSTRHRGPECAGCTQLRGDLVGTVDGDVLDIVAATLLREGIAGLCLFNRLYFQDIRPGLADAMGVTGWCDCGAPPGERWSHLVGVREAYLEAEAAAAAAAAKRRELLVPREPERWSYEGESRALHVPFLKVTAPE